MSGLFQVIFQISTRVAKKKSASTQPRASLKAIQFIYSFASLVLSKLASWLAASIHSESSFRAPSRLALVSASGMSLFFFCRQLSLHIAAGATSPELSCTFAATTSSRSRILHLVHSNLWTEHSSISGGMFTGFFQSSRNTARPPQNVSPW